MKKLLLTAALIFSVILLADAQGKAKFKFEEETFDFGTIKEDKGAVEHKFVFTNIGDAPLSIAGVQASCGCTTPGWTKDPIPPGEKGFILAKFDPKNRPGSFRKSLTITSNAEPQQKVIYIMGMVEKKAKTAADMYTQKIGDLRLKYQSMNIGNITTEKPVTRTFDIYNDGPKPITFLDKTEAPEHITVSIDPEELSPQAQGKLLITYIPRGIEDLGFVSFPIKVYTDEAAFAEKSLRVIATIEEYFPPMTAEQLAQAPKLSISKTTHDFGDLRKRAVVNATFILTNSGKSELSIRQIKPNCGCISVSLEKESLAPGERTDMKIEYDTTGRRGSDQKSIVLFSNDPSTPTQRITIKARIADPS